MPASRPTRIPLAASRNLGALTAAELEACGVDSLATLQRIGWEEALERWVARWPERAARARRAPPTERLWVRAG